MTWQYDGRCLTCGGRGEYSTNPFHDWVPPTMCNRCDGTGFDPAAATFAEAFRQHPEALDQESR